jgi:hypothetical protein
MICPPTVCGGAGTVWLFNRLIDCLLCKGTGEYGPGRVYVYYLDDK